MELYHGKILYAILKGSNVDNFKASDSQLRRQPDVGLVLLGLLVIRGEKFHTPPVQKERKERGRRALLNIKPERRLWGSITHPKQR